MDISPGARIIVVGTPEEDEQKIIACAEAGVAGYHLRSDSLDDLIMLIHNVARGKSIFPPRVSAILHRRLSNLASQPQPAGRGLVLTTREAQILKMLELAEAAELHDYVNRHLRTCPSATSWADATLARAHS